MEDGEAPQKASFPSVIGMNDGDKHCLERPLCVCCSIKTGRSHIMRWISRTCPFTYAPPVDGERYVDVGRDVLPDAASIALQVLARAAFSFFFFAKFIKLVSLH